MSGTGKDGYGVALGRFARGLGRAGSLVDVDVEGEKTEPPLKLCDMLLLPTDPSRLELSVGDCIVSPRRAASCAARILMTKLGLAGADSCEAEFLQPDAVRARLGVSRSLQIRSPPSIFPRSPPKVPTQRDPFERERKTEAKSHRTQQLTHSSSPASSARNRTYIRSQASYTRRSSCPAGRHTGLCPLCT